MLCIVSPHTDPYFNAAAEEYFFRDFSEDCFILYRNNPAVIVGKHQSGKLDLLDDLGPSLWWENIRIPWPRSIFLLSSNIPSLWPEGFPEGAQYFTIWEPEFCLYYQ